MNRGSPPTAVSAADPVEPPASTTTDWSGSAPRKEGYFWYWNEDADEPVLLRVYRHSDGEQYLAFTSDYRKFPVDDLSGYWLWGGPFGEPEPPSPPD